MTLEGRSRAAFAVRYVAEEEPEEAIAGGVHAAERTTVRAVRCILGALDLAARPVQLDLMDCLVDGGGGKAIDGLHAEARLVRCTFFGEVDLSRLSRATGVLFERRLRVDVPSEGMVRCSYLPAGSRTPPQEPLYRCRSEGQSNRHPGWRRRCSTRGRSVIRRTPSSARTPRCFGTAARTATRSASTTACGRATGWPAWRRSSRSFCRGA